jgi:hypothetical protein
MEIIRIILWCMWGILFRAQAKYFGASLRIAGLSNKIRRGILRVTNEVCCFLMALQPLWAQASFSFLTCPQSAGLLGRVISSSQGLYLNTGQHKHRINAYTQQTFMLWMWFEPTITASGRAKNVHALDRSATVTGSESSHLHNTVLILKPGT